VFVDLTGQALVDYRSAQVDPDDFDDFWATTLGAARQHDLGLTVTPVQTGLATVDVYDVTFAGFDGQPISAWLRIPRGVAGPLPAVVEYVGYGGGRGAPFASLLWSAAGYAHLQMDTRGQGSAWSLGATPDAAGSGPQVPGFLTRGIESRESFYYRRLITDAVRATDAAKKLVGIDAGRIAVLGRSQGGGLALAAAGLVPDLSAVLAGVPFLCDFPRASVITDAIPYKEIGQYLATHRHATGQVHRTLAYFDGVNFAKRAMAPAWITVGLMDAVCPPSTVYAAFHNYGGEKNLTPWEYNGHEGGGPADEAIFLAALAGVFGQPSNSAKGM
jgi:cephalosporin-C deacetylase